MVKEFDVRTHHQVEFIDITEIISKFVKDSKIQNGVCYVFVPHTTAGITINENADPNVVRDIIETLDSIVPLENDYLHSEGNSAAHIKAGMMGLSQMVIVENGKLKLGTWQGIYFCEFDGPRSRKVWVKIV